MRTAAVNRKTLETDISLVLALDGNGEAEVATGIEESSAQVVVFEVPPPEGLVEATVLDERRAPGQQGETH